MKKSYNWEEIRNFLVKELNKSQHILTFGTIGSLNVEHDIDVIITKKTSSKTSDFYREIHSLFNHLDKYLKKRHRVKVIRLPSISYKEELLKLSNYKKGDLVFHSMIYTSYPQIERDWNWALFEGEKVREILINNYKCLTGNVKDISSKEFQNSLYADPIFIFLNLYDRINSNYSEKMLVKVMSSYYDFLYRKKLKLPTPIIKDRRDVERIFYLLCDKADSLH